MDAVFTLTVSTPSAIPVSVTATVTDGTAMAGAGDYAATNAVVTIPAGQPGAAFTVRVAGDEEFESPDEVFYVDLSAPSGCRTSSLAIGTFLSAVGRQAAAALVW